MQTLDLYPAAVSYDADVGQADYRKARVFIRDGRVRVWIDSSAGLTLAIDATVVEIERVRGLGRYRITTDVGTLQVSRASGCGCGSRLKALSASKAWS